ncbi:hypothetical protein A8C32_10395 [Flavivirga aquatica]|uniref:PA14 domain-containing protein n=1 Tax=Flavivirga aquatica TaxID=1849968 RepID=A0A1E5TCN3_9FLAO|nr:thrombospondin type 3 repeat-containing protein [Flavivirga aquatica]OEK09135.1 hypothetical protein A8C32_10395 [Flavivirga aquatica]
MIHSIRKSKFSKIIASYLAIQLLITTVQPSNLFALTGGAAQPEFNSFTPIGTSDMVDLASGDFNYNIPIMDVGGYPLNLAYNSGVTMDQEASWVGLGWNLNVGQINRQVRGIPDDFKGDVIETEQNIRNNVTVNVDAKFDAQVFGIELPDQTGLKFGVNLLYNNYTGISFSPSLGLSFSLAKSSSARMSLNVSGSATEGATVSPGISLKGKLGEVQESAITGELNAGISYNSARGLSSFNLSSSIESGGEEHKFERDGKETSTKVGASSIGGSGSVSFANTTMTPRKRTAYTNFTGTLALSLGPDVWGLDGEVEVSASASVQKIKDPFKEDKAFGYEFTGYATSSDLLDYNRENDGIISKNTLALPVTNYTYDLYSVKAQGSGGMFRPFRSQVGQINDEYVKDRSDSFSAGIEVEGGSGFHGGYNFTVAPSKSHTGIWNTNATSHFKQDKEEIKSKDYEPVYFKYIGENRIDKDSDLFLNKLGGYNAIALDIDGEGFGKEASNLFVKKVYRTVLGENNEPIETSYNKKLENFRGKFKRTKRDVRNQSIQKINRKELGDYYNQEYLEPWLDRNTIGKDHHTAEIRMLQGDGSHYIFGEPAYNIEKQEVTFATDSNNGNCATGEVIYAGKENSRNNSSGRDNFFNKVKTPEYVHTYLLSSVLSSDYEDLTGNGPSDDDLGAYTRFEYQQFDSAYNWRVPYGKNSASYNEGLNTDRGDQKGNYVFGKKELKYIKKIETKTHVALFELSKRKDARGVAGVDGGKPSSGNYMYKLDKVSLYSKPEYEVYKDILEDNDKTNDPKPEQLTAIKTAHFVYDYSQCKNVENNHGGIKDENELLDETTGNLGKGKLTLKKVYFTYRDSKMGKYNPYEFHYDGFNPSYHLKAYDVWGNYKPIVEDAITVTNKTDVSISIEENDLGNLDYCGTNDKITAPEFAFVQQENRLLQDEFASAWSLTSIDLPSGGRIDLEYESDDYQNVQDRAAMQMFKVLGAGRDSTPSGRNELYEPNRTDKDARFLYVKIPETDRISSNKFKERYLRGQEGKPIYFRFLMNMTKRGEKSLNSKDYDYVTGYFELTGEDIEVTKMGSDIVASIPMVLKDMEGGIGGNQNINPINKAGLNFARNYLNAQSLGLNADYRTENIKTIAKNVLSSFASLNDILRGPNAKLRSFEYTCARKFKPEKSWIRLTNPNNYKLGGGVRVKSLAMHDQWDEMVGASGNTHYRMKYGQIYDYTLSKEEGSSGVATFEPNGSKENPFVEPFYNIGERLIAPREVSYIEKPFGASFFPSPTVTYSKVTVSNLKRDGITKHATGKVVSEYYTSKDFPTQVDHTVIDGPGNFATNENDVLGSLIKGIIGIPIRSKTEMTLSQGFVVHTNDMNGKMKKQSVFAEDAELDEPLSYVENIYSTVAGSPNKLDNKVTVIDKTGKIMTKQTVAVDYDVVTDFRESYSKSDTKGLKGNLVAIPIPPIVLTVPTIFNTDISIENTAHSAITTKVIHTTAIMKEKIASDLGATVRTTNEAWDAQTGQVLLTKTVNEYDDQYYNLNFPAYWAYDNMGAATKNIGITGVLKQGANGYYTYTDGKAGDYFALGDEIIGKYKDKSEKLWVVGFNDEHTALLLMNRFGQVVNKSASDIDNALEIEGDIRFKIIRSGYRNQQSANMASITMMKNPIKNGEDYVSNIDTSSFTQNESTVQDLRIVNASAVGYTDFWNCQCERGLPSLPFVTPTSSDLANLPIEDFKFNPYLFNTYGEWRAEKSYAYLTERTKVTQGVSNKVNNRKEGYFKDFTPYYITEDKKWKENETTTNKWTNASEVTQYSPYGAEVENQDALGRYSSAQYGYNMTLPTAVSSNSRYRYMGADNFEDYNYSSSVDLKYFDYVKGEGVPEEHFSFKKAANDDGAETGVIISDDFSHTGMNSLLIPKRDDAIFRRPLKGELPKNLDYDGDTVPDIEDNCPYTENRNQRDYDGDGIGNVCDDDVIPRISSIDTKRQETYRIKRSFFTIEGKPNDVVRYRTSISRSLRRGQLLFVNGKDVGDNEIGEITLDVTGKARVEFMVKANRPKKKKQRGRALGHFVILNKNSDIPVFGVEIRLCPVAYKDKRSGNGDKGEASWNCDTTN